MIKILRKIIISCQVRNKEISIFDFFSGGNSSFQKHPPFYKIAWTVAIIMSICRRTEFEGSNSGMFKLYILQ